ncbi:MAG: porin [bacterium]
MKFINVILVTLLLHLSGSMSVAQDSRLHFYGYFDVEIEGSNKDAAGKRWTFDQHHFNVVTIYRLDDRFRVFGEIEWEHGVQHEAGGSNSSGLIALERAWLEFKYSDAFKVKVGKFLPPFGIYNLKHDASPTFLSTFLPNSIYGKHNNTLGKKQRLFAKFATGVQVLGTLFANQWQGEYYLYLSNGRGPDPGSKDNNSNKAVGGRFVVSPPVEQLRFGLSFYTDKNGDANNTEQTTLAFDAALNYSNVQIEAEFFLPKLEKVDTTGTPNGTFQTGIGYYVQGAYTFIDKLTPFARYDFFDPDDDTTDDGETDIVLGINFSVNPKVYLKSEIHFLSFQNPNTKSYELFVSAITVAF